MNNNAKPFLVYHGGKRRLINEIKNLLPNEKINNYFEPFVGGGAVFFMSEINSENYFLSDINPLLINSYEQLRDNFDDIKYYVLLYSQNINRDKFIKIRSMANSHDISDEKQAAILIVLSKYCFGGVIRLNKDNKINSSFGKEKRTEKINIENLYNCHLALQGVDIQNRCYSEIPIKKDAFYYLDPPYHLTHNKYLANNFEDDFQKKLACFYTKIDEAGGKVMLSSSNTPLIEALYEKFNIHRVKIRYSINAKNIAKKEELIITNYENIL